jgi:hypothetical protein
MSHLSVPHDLGVVPKVDWVRHPAVLELHVVIGRIQIYTTHNINTLHHEETLGRPNSGKHSTQQHSRPELHAVTAGISTAGTRRDASAAGMHLGLQDAQTTHKTTQQHGGFGARSVAGLATEISSQCSGCGCGCCGCGCCGSSCCW